MSEETSLVRKDILEYNNLQQAEYKKICNKLAMEIGRNLPEAESKIWHAHPVWFLDGNPVAGYSQLKSGIRLMFWSGQSFKEEGLQKTGSFKAAEIIYTTADAINTNDLRRWLEKAKEIQWDYKNIVKRKGVLKRLK